MAMEVLNKTQDNGFLVQRRKAMGEAREGTQTDVKLVMF